MAREIKAPTISSELTPSRVMLVGASGLITDSVNLQFVSSSRLIINQATDDGVYKFQIAGGIRTEGTAGTIGLNLSASDMVADLRVIRNTNNDKALFLQYNAGASSELYAYSDNIETLRLAGGRASIGGIASDGSSKLLVDGTVTSTVGFQFKGRVSGNGGQLYAEGSRDLRLYDNDGGADILRIYQGRMLLGIADDLVSKLQAAGSVRIQVATDHNFRVRALVTPSTEIYAANDANSGYTPFHVNGLPLVLNYDSVGKLLIGTIVDDGATLVQAAGSVGLSAGSLFVNKDGIASYFGVAHFDGNPGNITTGTLKITLPKSWTNTMLRITIRGYAYNSGRGGWSVVVSGYTYSASPSWINTSKEITGNPPFTSVRLAHDGTKCIILLGTTSTSWDYPKIDIDVMAAHSNIAGWDTGWLIGEITSEAGITGIVTPPTPVGAASSYVALQAATPGTQQTGNSNIDGISIAGNALIGTWNTSSNYATFSNSSNNTATNYALLQGISGDTYLNAASGQSVFTRINNTTVIETHNAGMSVTGAIAASSYISATNLLSITGPAETDRYIQFSTGGVARWYLGADTTAEAGASAGSNLAIYRFDDGGSFLGTILNINRATGLATLYNNLVSTAKIQSSTLTNSLVDTFTYDGDTIHHYGVGWYNDSWNSGGSTGYLSGYGGLKFFVAGVLGATLDSVGAFTSISELKSENGTAWTTAGWSRQLWLKNNSAPAIEFASSGTRRGIGWNGVSLYFFTTTSDGTGSSPIYDLSLTSGRLQVGGIADDGVYSGQFNGPIRALSNYSTYIGDGLFGATALPSKIITPALNELRFGYKDDGNGSYVPRIGFKQVMAGTVTGALNSIGNEINGDFTIGVGSANTERFRIVAASGTTQIGGSTTITPTGAVTTVSVTANAARMTDWVADPGYAVFAHNTRNTVSGYALLQGSSGDTYLNAEAGQEVTVRVNNTNVARFTATFGQVIGSLGVTGGIQGTQYLAVTGEVETDRYINFQTNGVARWLITANAEPESGSVNGSNFAINRYNDAGAYIDTPLIIIRSTGLATFSNAVFAPTAAGGTNNTQIATTAFVSTAIAATGASAWTRNATDGIIYPTTNGDILDLRSQYHNVGTFYINDVPTNGIKIKTNIPNTASTGMPVIILEGKNYGTGEIIDLKISWYPFDPGTGVVFLNTQVVSAGGYRPVVKLSFESGKIVIFLEDTLVNQYFNRFTIRVIDPGWGSSAYMTGWTVVDEALSGGTGTVTVPYDHTDSFHSLKALVGTSGNILTGVGTGWLSTTPDAAGLVAKSGTQTGIAGNKTWTGVQTVSNNLTVTGVVSLGNSTLGANTTAVTTTATFNGASGLGIGQYVLVTDSGSGSSNVSALTVSMGGSGTGSGNKYLVDLQDGSTSRFTVTRAGAITGTGGFSVSVGGVVTGTTFSGSGASLTGIPQSAVSSLTSDLALKAPLSNTVTITGTQAVTGQKTFTDPKFEWYSQTRTMESGGNTGELHHNGDANGLRDHYQRFFTTGGGGLHGIAKWTYDWTDPSGATTSDHKGFIALELNDTTGDPEVFRAVATGSGTAQLSVAGAASGANIFTVNGTTALIGAVTVTGGGSFTAAVTGVTATAGDNTTKFATTAFVTAAVAAGGGGGGIDGINDTLYWPASSYTRTLGYGGATGRLRHTDNDSGNALIDEYYRKATTSKPIARWEYDFTGAGGSSDTDYDGLVKLFVDGDDGPDQILTIVHTPTKTELAVGSSTQGGYDFTVRGSSYLNGDLTVTGTITGAISGSGTAPVGTVTGWLKDLGSGATPALSAEWVECNGQTISDAASPYNGIAVPNLNGASSATKRFLRGASTSGGTGGSETHTHTITTSTTSTSLSGSGTSITLSVTSPTGATSTLPSYYEVVWIVRIK